MEGRPSVSEAPKRSRGGCWTCRSRHKKCDEAKPQCTACVKAGRHCGGYGTRLAWGKPQRDAKAQNLAELFGPGKRTRSAKTPTSEPSSSNAELEAQLMGRFSESGQYTLTGRSLGRNESLSDMITLSASWPALKNVCLAYQAHHEDQYRILTHSFLEEALRIYQCDLQDPEKLNHDATLTTGVLLCSVGIETLYQWTMHLEGLEAILEHRNLIDPRKRNPSNAELVEVIGLFDLPTVTIGRLSSSRRIWSRYLAPHSFSGVDPTSGLPHSLINIFAQLGSPGVEGALLAWPGERGDDYAHHHYWEAFRFSGVLNSRALLTPENDFPDTEVLMMKILASVEAMVSSPRDPFKQPLRHSIIYPLFSAGLYTLEDSVDRAFVTGLFQDLISSSKSLQHQLAFDVLLEVWNRRGSRPRYTSLSLAEEFAIEMSVELHLY